METRKGQLSKLVTYKHIWYANIRNGVLPSDIEYSTPYFRVYKHRLDDTTYYCVLSKYQILNNAAINAIQAIYNQHGNGDKIVFLSYKKYKELTNDK